MNSVKKTFIQTYRTLLRRSDRGSRIEIHLFSFSFSSSYSKVTDTVEEIYSGFVIIKQLIIVMYGEIQL